MTDAIPDEIMREAAGLFTDARMSAVVDAATCMERIARALMARDKRAAEIVRNTDHNADDAAKAILTYEASDAK